MGYCLAYLLLLILAYLWADNNKMYFWEAVYYSPEGAKQTYSGRDNKKYCITQNHFCSNFPRLTDILKLFSYNPDDHLNNMFRL